MRFRCNIYPASDPTEPRPVIVAYQGISHAADPHTNGTPTTGLQLLVSVNTDRDTDGVPDTLITAAQKDIQRRFDADSSQFGVIDARFTGTGNFMATIRAYLKTQVTAHNNAVNPGGAATSFVDLDTD